MMITRFTHWQGEEAVLLQGGGYEALVLPGWGANCVSLRHLGSRAELLRTPPDQQALRVNPNVYGLPLLFPPNRIRDGSYAYNGTRYRFPINEPARNHHIHGFLSSTPFEWLGGADFAFHANEENPYLSFPHAFCMKRSFLLDEAGLSQTLFVENNSRSDMPLGIGFHTAWNVPLIRGGSAGDYRLRIPVKAQWLYDPDTIIPTGESLSDSPLIQSLREGSLVTEGQAVSCLLECRPGLISLSGPGGTLVCERDERFRFVMLWNGDGQQNFVCPEPQSWMVDAPNLPLPPEITGFEYLKPGERRAYRLRYYFEQA